MGAAWEPPAGAAGAGGSTTGGRRADRTVPGQAAPAAPGDSQPELPGMPARLVTVTPSRLGTYEDCPRRYRYQYLDRPAPAKGPPWAHNSLGASVHGALRAWYDLPPAQRGRPVLGRLLAAAWVREGYRDVAQERAVWRRAIDWLESYLDSLPAEPLGVERTVAARTDVMALQGRVDRIDDRADGLVVVDYKTGRTAPTVAHAQSAAALALYAHAVARVFRRPCHRVELHHLPTGTVAAAELTRERIDRQVRRAEATARDIRDGQRALAEGADPAETFPAQPGARCGWCDFRRVCPAGRELPGQQPWAAVERLVGQQEEDDTPRLGDRC